MPCTPSAAKRSRVTELHRRQRRWLEVRPYMPPRVQPYRQRRARVWVIRELERCAVGMCRCAGGCTSPVTGRLVSPADSLSGATGVMCPPLSLAHGSLHCTDGDDYGSTCTATCGSGYNLTGSTNRTCTSHGSWTGSASLCAGEPPPPPSCHPRHAWLWLTTCLLRCQPPVAVCPALSLPNGTVSCTDGDDFGSVCTLTCDAGFQRNGPARRACGPAGQWNGTRTQCTDITCPVLPQPPSGSGHLTCTRGNQGGSTCLLACSTGYNVTGTAARTCEATGNWSGTPSHCQGAVPPPPR